jgi:signal transduction histidine kinase
MLGYALGEMIGRPVTDFYRPAGSNDMSIENLRQIGHIDNFEVEFVGKDGRTIWTSINAKALIDEQKGFIGAEAIVRDISQIKKALTEKTQLQENLRQSQKMESIGTLAGGIAHDFNNSLAGIVGGAYILQDDSLPAEQRREYVNLILKAAQRAGELTKKLLAFSRKTDKVTKPVDVTTIINDTITMLHRTIDKKIAIGSKFLAGNTWVMGDYTLLQNVFLNLGINAGHAMPDGGTLDFIVDTVVLTEDYCRLSPFKITCGNYLKISVTDTGCGIPPEILSRIFEPFFTTKEPGKGTGLGLAAVYGTIQDHNGAIGVVSEVNRGTTFDIFLPLSEMPALQPLEEPPPPRGSGTILIIDDEEMIRTTLSVLLTRLGYKILTAENGHSGLSLYKTHCSEIRLVLLDMIMPTMAGRETFKVLQEIDPTLPIIVITGFSGEKDLQSLLGKGVAGVIHKPFRELELAQMIAKFLPTKNATDTVLPPKADM